MIKVLGLALYGPLAASTRYRLGQYVPGLASFGIDLRICHLLGDDYLRQRFAGGGWALNAILRGALGRLSDLVQLRDYDLAILHCELFPLMPGWLERALICRPYIYDFDDAFYLKYRQPRFGSVSAFLSDKFDNVMANASAITAGNNILSEYARKFSPNTFSLPTVVDTSRYLLGPPNPVNRPFTIGWIGSPSTAPYLAQLVKPLSKLGREGPVRFIVIGGNAPVVSNVETVEIPWQEDTEVELLNQFDVGVMPLPDDDWARGKCAFKLIQYMACGVPVIASPIGANIDVVSPNGGLLASSPEEWLMALRQLRDSPQLRQAMGRAGRKQVIDNYSLANNLPRLAGIIRSVAKK
jgi:glycosyltransferase involved in cell wall biosynthesis